MDKVDTTPDAFLDSLPEEVGRPMSELDSIITSCLPGRVRILWEGRLWGGTEQRIIGYGDVVQPRAHAAIPPSGSWSVSPGSGVTSACMSTLCSTARTCWTGTWVGSAR